MKIWWTETASRSHYYCISAHSHILACWPTRNSSTVISLNRQSIHSRPPILSPVNSCKTLINRFNLAWRQLSVLFMPFWWQSLSSSKVRGKSIWRQPCQWLDASKVTCYGNWYRDQRVSHSAGRSDNNRCTGWFTPFPLQYKVKGLNMQTK